MHGNEVTVDNAHHALALNFFCEGTGNVQMAMWRKGGPLILAPTNPLFLEWLTLQGLTTST
jgi:hypothetical protein